jgi:hypothetical protein
LKDPVQEWDEELPKNLSDRVNFFNDRQPWGSTIGSRSGSGTLEGRFAQGS